MSGKSKLLTIGSDEVKKVRIGLDEPLVFIGGPCAIESRQHAFMMAEMIMEICEKVKINWIYKSCYDKDCRSSPKSFHGLGLEHGLTILSDLRKEFSIPVVSDFSDPAWAPATGEVCDLVQVPAYLCRQTSIFKSCCKNLQTCSFKKRSIHESLEYEKFCKKIRVFWL